MRWIELNNQEQLESIFNSTEPLVLFKHSTRCSVSNMALKYFEKEWNSDQELPTYFLDVLQNRTLSNLISERFHVHHETPQILVIQNKECILDASHQDISAQEVLEVLEKKS
jgi:bacillithiol system protein YtxJ